MNDASGLLYQASPTAKLFLLNLQEPNVYTPVPQYPATTFSIAATLIYALLKMLGSSKDVMRFKPS
jgi:hypothetical protein